MEQNSTFGLALKPGLIITLAIIAFHLIIWSLVSDVEKQGMFGWFNLLIIGGGYYYFTVEYRDRVKEGFISFGESFVFMLLMSVVTAIVYAIYYYIFLSFIDPSFLTNSLEMVADKYAETGMEEEQIEQALKIVSYIYQPWLMAVFALFSSIIGGVVIGLVVSLMTKKEAPINFDNYQN